MFSCGLALPLTGRRGADGNTAAGLQTMPHSKSFNRSAEQRARCSVHRAVTGTRGISA